MAAIRASCGVAVRVLREVGRHIGPGVSTADLDAAAARAIRVLGAVPAVPAGFPGSICLSVNEVAAHAPPGPRRLAAGDLVTVDVAVRRAGWCGDVAWTYVVGQAEASSLRLLAAARAAIRAAVRAVRAGGRIGDIGAAVRRAAARWGCSVLPELVGHGIGRDLHEEPEVPYTGAAGQGLRLVPGMVITVEPALSPGRAQTRSGGDGWSHLTADGAPCAQFEHTLAIFAAGTEVLTGAAEEESGRRR